MGSALAHLHQSMRRLASNRRHFRSSPPWIPSSQSGTGRRSSCTVTSTQRTSAALAGWPGSSTSTTAATARLLYVANALYMVLFDDMTGRQPSVYPSFHEAFLSGYSNDTGDALDPNDVSGFIDLRVTALQSWLDKPATAPVGIRNSPPAWHKTLQAFVRRYQDQR